MCMSITESLSIYWKNIVATIVAIPEYLNLKLLGAYLVTTYSFFFDVGKAELMEAILFLVIFDCLTGVYAAKVRGEPIESRKMIKSAFKLVVYGISVSSMHLIDKVISI